MKTAIRCIQTSHVFPALVGVLLLAICSVVHAAPGDILFVERFNNNGDFNSDWSWTGTGNVQVSNATFGAAARSLSINGGQVTVTSDPGNINANVPGVDFSIWIRRGDDTFSENPDAGEDLSIEYLSSTGTWIQLASYPGGGTPGEILTPTFSLPADALYSGLQVRFILAQGSGANFDYWHIDDVVFTETAAPVPPSPVGEWRMDETTWNGTAGEAMDSSGGANGTAVGGAITDNTSPAVAGDPGTCGYGVFDGVDDYLNVAGISGTLNATASLAFWINTTQTGSDTGWQAPGVTGVEESGGADDIFWGWLDASGRIGISVGNDYTTKSTVSINDGSWHHIVLTRDHVAGTYKIYIDGSLNNSGTIAGGVIGNGYASIGRIEDTGGSPEYFAGQLDEVRIYDQVLSDSDVSTIFGETHDCNLAFCAGATPRGGLLGDYYNSMDLSGGIVGSRVDAPVDFDWAAGAPGVTGVGTNQFSVEWNGYVRATETGNYRFQTVSDDGVRLWVDSQLIIDRWNDHAATTDTSTNVFLTAGQEYPVVLHFYENGGQAEIRLRWETPSAGTFVAIPGGPEPVLGAGLYYCDASVVVVDHYAISHAGTGVTCEAEPITITAHDSADNPMAPAAGTQITLSTTPAGGAWSGGNTFVFDGSTTSAVMYLQQLTPATLSIDVTDGLATETEDPDITFTDTGLRFYGDTALSALPNQVAGVADNNLVLRAVETSTDTGACVARVQNTSRQVNLAYECRDPATCSSGQTLSLDGNAVQANDNGAAVTYTATTLNFDANGFAPIPFQYSDVGRIRLHGVLDLPAEGDEPAISIPGTSSEFIVKPYTLAIVQVQRPDTSLNPATTNSGAGFVAAGDNFTAIVEAQNFQGNRTPAFGREAVAETVRAEITNLVYPAGGSSGALSGAGSFNPVAGVPGQAENVSLSWSQAGSLTLTPRLGDNDYMGAGDLTSLSESGTIGRFYPFEYVLSAATTTDACGIFSYMGQPAIQVNYVLEARGNGLGALTNYDSALGYAGTAVPGYVAENADSGVDLGSRVTVLPAGTWSAGLLTVNAAGSVFARDPSASPEAPLTQLQLGLTVSDTLDNRPLASLDMNAATTGDCLSAGNCDAKALGTEMEMHFGRLRLENAFGPETAALPVSFVSEYWDGSLWVQNTDDSCTQIAAADISYPNGPIDNAANLTTAIGGGATTGSYDSLAGGMISFTGGDAGQSFSPPGAGNTGSVTVDVDLTSYPWLWFDWNQDGAYTDSTLPVATFTFGSYRGHDRVIYWREVLQ